MTRCDDLQARLPALVGEGALPDSVMEHLATCSSCRAAADRLQGLIEAGSILREIQPSPELIARIKGLPRLSGACESALVSLDDVLEGRLDSPGRSHFLQHLQACDPCRTVWEALATLRQVGRATAPPPRLLGDLAIHPTRRVQVRRRRWVPDLRMAAAAAYILAALTVLMAGNPARWQWAEGESVGRMAFLARAAVENRITRLSLKVRDQLVVAGDLAWGTAEDVFNRARKLLSSEDENSTAPKRVGEGGNGGAA